MSAPSAVQTPSRPKMDTKTMVSIAMLTGIAYIVMLLSKLMPSVMFLDFDFKDVVVCIGRLHLQAPSPPPSSLSWWPSSRCSPSATPAPLALS